MSEVWDQGLQPERTALAWQRTALATGTAALAVGRLALDHGSVAGVVTAVATVVLAVVTAVRARLGYRRLYARAAAGRLPGRVGPAVLATASVSLLGIATLALVLY